MASRGYYSSRTKNTTLSSSGVIRSHDTASSDLFDKMVESSKTSKLEPPSLKIKPGTELKSYKSRMGMGSSKVAVKRKNSNSKAAIMYNFSHKSSPSPQKSNQQTGDTPNPASIEATPISEASSQPNHNHENTGEGSSISSNSVSGCCEADKLKVFDFDFEDEDFDSDGGDNAPISTTNPSTRNINSTAKTFTPSSVTRTISSTARNTCLTGSKATNTSSNIIPPAAPGINSISKTTSSATRETNSINRSVNSTTRVINPVATSVSSNTTPSATNVSPTSKSIGSSGKGSSSTAKSTSLTTRGTATSSSATSIDPTTKSMSSLARGTTSTVKNTTKSIGSVPKTINSATKSISVTSKASSLPSNHDRNDKLKIFDFNDDDELDNTTAFDSTNSSKQIGKVRGTSSPAKSSKNDKFKCFNFDNDDDETFEGARNVSSKSSTARELFDDGGVYPRHNLASRIDGTPTSKRTSSNASTVGIPSTKRVKKAIFNSDSSCSVSNSVPVVKPDYSNRKRNRSISLSPAKKKLFVGEAVPQQGMLIVDKKNKEGEKKKEEEEKKDADMLQMIDSMLGGGDSFSQPTEMMGSSQGKGNALLVKKPLLRKSYSANSAHSSQTSSLTNLKRPLNVSAKPPRNDQLRRTYAGPQGRDRQIVEEARYLLESIKPTHPINLRCLGVCKLASHYLDPEFSRPLRIYRFTSRVVVLLKDCLKYPALCLAAAVLFYVMTRNKSDCDSSWGKAGAELLAGLLESPDTSAEDLPTKEAREMARIKTKTRSILEKVADQTSQGMDTPPPEDEDDDEELPLSQPLEEKEEGEEEQKKKQKFRVSTEEILVPELARECLISLTSPQYNLQWLREELRLNRALDKLANMLISSCDSLSSVNYAKLGCSVLHDQSVRSICRQTETFERQLKAIENLTMMNHGNQSYLIIFDGSLLISKLTRFLGSGHQLLFHKELRYSVQNCLLGVFKVLLNLTHNSELGSRRVGEQKEVMENIFKFLLQFPEAMKPGEQFDISVLALGLLINLIENSSPNCRLLELMFIDPASPKGKSHGAGSGNDVMDDDDLMGIRKQKSALRVLVNLFLKHNARAESANIEVPTPQRLSQLNVSSPQRTATSSSSSSSSLPSSSHSLSSGAVQMPKGKTDRRLTNVPKGGSSPQKALGKSHVRDPPSAGVPRRSNPPSDGAGMGVAMSLPAPPPRGEGEGEDFEKIEIDPLVFDRDEYNTALDQAGRHMEDSILASYTALLLGIVAERNHDNVDYIRNLMPSGNFTEMLTILRKFISFMNMTGASTAAGLDSMKHTMKYLEALSV